MAVTDSRISIDFSMDFNGRNVFYQLYLGVVIRMSNKQQPTLFLPKALHRDSEQLRSELLDIFRHMFQTFGDRKWWPAESREEMIVGAILVQSVSWANTVKAIDKLRGNDLLSFPAIAQADLEQIESCIVSTLYYRMKAKKLKAFATHVVDHYQGDLDVMFGQPLADLRSELLNIYGVGQETADDIVLYAANLPSFVVDTYTKRIFHRLGYVAADIPYEALRHWFMTHLPADVSLYNQYHALLDGIGHHFCSNKRPKCIQCPLADVCQYSLQ